LTNSKHRNLLEAPPAARRSIREWSIFHIWYITVRSTHLVSHKLPPICIMYICFLPLRPRYTWFVFEVFADTQSYWRLCAHCPPLRSLLLAISLDPPRITIIYHNDKNNYKSKCIFSPLFWQNLTFISISILKLDFWFLGSFFTTFAFFFVPTVFNDVAQLRWESQNRIVLPS
jgi:hypothetical protein